MYQKDHDGTDVRYFQAVHGGKGQAGVKSFTFDDVPTLANFLIYDFPPGASEGVHVHRLDDDDELEAYDEFYYVLSGEGQMQIDDEIVPVSQGDHIHTPLGVYHGIENTSSTKHLRVFLTFVSCRPSRE